MTWRIRKHPGAPIGHAREVFIVAGPRTFVVNKVKGCWMACEFGPRGGVKRGKWFDGARPSWHARRWCEERARKYLS